MQALSIKKDVFLCRENVFNTEMFLKLYNMVVLVELSLKHQDMKQYFQFSNRKNNLIVCQFGSDHHTF